MATDLMVCAATLALRCEDTARKETSPDELNSFLHELS